MATLAAGCSGASRGAESGAPPQETPRPLAAIATQPIALLPAQYVRGGDSTGWADRVGPQRDFLRAIDSAIVRELAARNTARAWVLPEALARMSRRNPASGADPYALSAEGLRAGVRRLNPALGEPLSTQIRSLIALTDARHALVPVEVRFEPAGDSARAILRVALLDGRLSQIQGAWDVASEARTPDVGALATSLAGKLADLIVRR